MTVWRPNKEDIGPALLIALLPLAAALPQLAGWLQSDPLLYSAQMSLDVAKGVLRGWPSIDPNHGFQTQALGYRAALDWLGGAVPWWNPYSGIGMPLAGEYQPAVFLPLTFLLLLPHGTVWLQLALQLLAGFGTYALLRQLALARIACTAGALLFAFDGTIAWLAHTPGQALALLPWTIFAIERAYAACALGVAGGWRLLAIAMGASLLTGAPEVAYIDGLMALAWAILRGVQLPRAARARFAGRIVLGGSVAIALAAPQLVAFLQYLPHASVGLHEQFARLGIPAIAAIPSLVAPYVYGPIFAYSDQWRVLEYVWGMIGGYVSIAVVIVAVHGGISRRDALAAFLAAWSLLALGKTFAIEPALTLWNLVPAIPIAAFFRYATPTWELAFVILAAFGVDRLASRAPLHRLAWRSSAATALAALTASIIFIATAWPHLAPHVGLRNSAAGALAWAAVTAVACLALMARAATSQRALVALVALLAADSALMFFIPSLSSARAARPDMEAIAFLRSNLGLQRFYTLGPIQPNYGAYFGVAAINHNYLPVPAAWTAWVKAHLDRGADDVSFTGNAPRAAGSPTAAGELRRNLDAFRSLGVKYVVARYPDEPFAASDAQRGVREVYTDPIIRIYDVSPAAPYFEARSKHCAVSATERLVARVECAEPDSLVRRELFFPGWKATVNGADTAIAAQDDLFQAVPLPRGSSEVRFRYAPAGVEWAWLASLAAVVVLVLGRSKARASKATHGANASVIGTAGDK